jgi:hypothetical protein
VTSARKWLVAVSIGGASGIEAAISVDCSWLLPAFVTQTPTAALDYVKGALVDARRGDDIFVELRMPEVASSYAAPTSDAAVSWLSSRLVEAWYATRPTSGTYAPAPGSSPARADGESSGT